MSCLKVGVIGAGRLGTLHARVYSELRDAQLVGICDSDPARAETVAQTFCTRTFTDHKTLLPLVDAVSIATPTISHFAIAKDALKAGKHVLVEKPITTDLQSAKTLMTLSQKCRRILQVGHIERFNSAFIATQRIATHPRFIECHRLSPFPNRSLDVGVVLDLMIHDIDIVLGLVNSPVTRIDAIGVSVLTPFEDIANVRLHFKNGCIANLTASRISDEPMRKIRIFLKGAYTYISLDYQAQRAFCYRKEQNAITKTTIPIEKEEPIRKEIESFIFCVKHERKPVVSGAEAFAALKLALRIQDSICRKKF